MPGILIFQECAMKTDSRISGSDSGIQLREAAALCKARSLKRLPASRRKFDGKAEPF